MKITKIEVQKHTKDRYNIYLDEDFAFGVAESVLIQYTLAKGMELTAAQVAQIKASDNEAQAYGKALNYLSHQLRSITEMQNFLQDKGYLPATINAIIAKLKTLNYLDDTNYAYSFIRTQILLNQKGPKDITRKLRQKGIAPTIITAALDAEYPLDKQIANGVVLTKKIVRQNHGKSFFALQQKLKQNLLQKGFTSETIQEIMNQSDLQKDDEAEYENLKKEAQKIWHRYAHKPNAQQKFKQALYRKGYNLDSIQKFLDEMPLGEKD